MYKILSICSLLLLTSLLSSCLFSNNVIVDEHEKKDNTHNKTQTDDRVVEIISQRKVVTRDDTDFIVADIQSNSNSNFMKDYSLTGLSKFSSQAAIDAVKLIKQIQPGIQFVVYFEFDSIELSEESKKIISYHNDFYSKNSNLTLELQGHTDIKGSREYNLSLGEQRALAVKKLMQDNINIVSFGEEKTISTTDSKNRRVEFIYK